MTKTIAQSKDSSKSREIHLNIAVLNRCPKNLMDTEDRRLVGMFSAVVHDCHDIQKAVTSVLNKFHDQYGINEVDDLALFVFDPVTEQLVEELEDCETEYSCDISETVDDMMRPYQVKVSAKMPEGTMEVGTAFVMGANKRHAEENAFALLWETGMSVAGAKAKYETQRCVL